MNRREATKQATDNFRTFADLRRLIADARHRGGMSRVNGSLRLSSALDIYEKAIAGRPDGDVAQGMRADGRRTRDSLIVQNILRDCA